MANGIISAGVLVMLLGELISSASEIAGKAFAGEDSAQSTMLD